MAASRAGQLRKPFLVQRTRISGIAVIGLLLLVEVGVVLAQLPSTGTPTPLSDYGVARVSTMSTFVGSMRIRLTVSGTAPFFVVSLVILLNRPIDVDVVLDSIMLDGATITVSGYGLGAPKVVVVSSGAVVGEIVSSLPDNLQVLLVTEPMGNLAFAATGGDVGGVTFTVRSTSGSYAPGTTMTATAMVTAPTNSTVMIEVMP